MKQIRIGIVGAESSHAGAIADVINIKKWIKGFKVDYIWGETKDAADKTAANYCIPNIVENPSQMMDKIDAVLIAHRDGKHHLKAAMPFIKAGIPAFIDKPLCCRLSEGKKFMDLCSKSNVPITSFSVLPLQVSFKKFLKKLPSAGKLLAASIQGTCNVNGPYGGVYFLGPHLVEMALSAFGNNIEEVSLQENRGNGVCKFFYDDSLIVTLNCIPSGMNAYGITIIGDKKCSYEPIPFDSNWYITGIQTFTRMFKTGKMPYAYESLLKPVQILEALEKSLHSGKNEKLKTY
ncbi:MAG: hypothetical protein A2Y10_03070 [Planctomycetes bacterium GWF2_41_51]|nr:MAG: hypothetical protein A2Y10_03070 [Planctomycetes bacterium GWF2_41_51]HBG26062.1 hypothetical protein [Phycisphaerales bacterium]